LEFFLVVEKQARESEEKTAKKSQGEILVDKAKFMMNQALGTDEAGSKDEAVKLYTTAVEFCLNAVSLSACRLSSRGKMMNFGVPPY